MSKIYSVIKVIFLFLISVILTASYSFYLDKFIVNNSIKTEENISKLLGDQFGKSYGIMYVVCLIFNLFLIQVLVYFIGRKLQVIFENRIEKNKIIKIKSIIIMVASFIFSCITWFSCYIIRYSLTMSNF